MRHDSANGARLRAALPFLPLIAALALSLAYWPGLVTWDSLRQYGQALDGNFDDWHPPVMEWIWRQFLPIAHSPAPMLLLQLALYAAGFALLIGAARRRGWTGRAIAIGCLALLPVHVALMATIIKDSLMAGALLCAAGLTMRAGIADTGRGAGRAMRIGALALCLFAATLRFNAFLAVLPLALWALPEHWRAMPLRWLASATVLLALLLAAMPVANRLVDAEPSGVTLSLIIFDLAGITERTGENQFPPLPVRDPVKANHGCYEPVRWDSYSWWVDPPCPIIFDGVKTSFEKRGINPRLFWLRAILRHPVAYAEHRLAHWNINARFLVPDEVERPVQVVAPPNDWGFAITRNPAVRVVDWAARASARTPLGWPCVWMAAMAGFIWASRGRGVNGPALVLAWSALLYGLGYGAFSVASELRYYLWTMIAGAIALALALPDLRRAGLTPGLLARLAGLPLVLSALCIAARIGLIQQ